MFHNSILEYRFLNSNFYNVYVPFHITVHLFDLVLILKFRSEKNVEK